MYFSIICRPKLFSNILTNFPKTIRELNLVISKDKTILRNHIDHPEKDVETVRLQWGMDSSEFTTYEVSEKTSIIIPSQDFISVMELAELYQSNLKMSFTKTGEPFIITVQNESCFLTTIVLATLKENTLKSLRKPKNIQNYKELINSYMGHNKKRKSETAAISPSKPIDELRHNSKSLRLANVSLISSIKHNSMSSSELELMESPFIEATNSMGNNSKQISHSSSNIQIRPSTSKAPKIIENTANLFAFNRKTERNLAKQKSILDDTVLDSTNDSALELELATHHSEKTVSIKRKTNEMLVKDKLTQQKIDNSKNQEIEQMDIDYLEKTHFTDDPELIIDQNFLDGLDDEEVRIQFSHCTDPEPWKKTVGTEDSEEIFRNVLHDRGNTSIINRIQQSEAPNDVIIIPDTHSHIERNLIHSANLKAHHLFGNVNKSNPKAPIIARVLIENSDDEDICSQL